MPYCYNGGLLVGPLHALAADDSDFQWEGRSPEVGCRRIRCTQCNQLIRVFPGTYLIPPEKERPDYRAIYESGGTHPQLKPWDPINLYVCHCGAERADSVDELGRVNELGWRRYPKWRCSGHAPASLPLVLEGVDVIAPPFDDLVRARFLGVRGGVTAIGLRSRLSDSGLEPEVDQAVERCVAESDVDLRAMALGYFGRFPSSAPAGRLLDRYRSNPEQWDDVPDPQPYTGVETLADRLFVTLGAVALAQQGLRQAYRAALRDMMLARPRPSLLMALMPIDPEWLLVNAETIAKREPNAILGLLVFGATRLTELVPLARVLVPLVPDRGALRRALQQRLNHAEAAAVIALL